MEGDKLNLELKCSDLQFEVKQMRLRVNDLSDLKKGKVNLRKWDRSKSKFDKVNSKSNQPGFEIILTVFLNSPTVHNLNIRNFLIWFRFHGFKNFFEYMVVSIVGLKLI